MNSSMTESIDEIDGKEMAKSLRNYAALIEGENAWEEEQVAIVHIDKSGNITVFSAGADPEDLSSVLKDVAGTIYPDRGRLN